MKRAPSGIGIGIGVARVASCDICSTENSITIYISFQDAECRLVALMSEHSVMGFGRKAKIPVVQETTMDTDGIGGDDIVTPPGK